MGAFTLRIDSAGANPVIFNRGCLHYFPFCPEHDERTVITCYAVWVLLLNVKQ